jgi:hypothetical protein
MTFYKLLNNAFLQSRENAPCANQPPVESTDLSDVLTNRAEFVALLLKQREMRPDIWAEWAVIQSVEKYELNW